MNRHLLLSLGIVGALVLVVVSPVGISYATSDSMAPVIDEGEGYVLVPPGDLKAGDIITFHSATEGGFVTHRIVREVERGYITKGDANPSTDQAAGLPPVSRADVVGKVLEIGGTPFTIPYLGTVATTVSENLVVIVAVLVAGALLRYRQLGRRRTTRSRLKVSDVIVGVAVGCVLVSSVFLVVSPDHTSFSYDRVGESTGPVGGARFLPVGEPATRTYDVTLVETALTEKFVDVEGAELVRTTVVNTSRESLLGIPGFARQKELRVTVRIPAGDTPGPTRTRLTVAAYPKFLPNEVVRSLRSLHPVVAAIGAALALFGPLAAAVWLLVDPRRPIRLSRFRWLG